MVKFKKHEADIVFDLDAMHAQQRGEALNAGFLKSAFKVLTKPVVKTINYMGWLNSTDVDFNLSDVNGDGRSCVSVKGTTSFTLRNSAGTVVGRPQPGKGAKSLPHTFILPAGEYNLEYINAST